MSKSVKTPAPPDPTATTQAQSQVNKQAAVDSAQVNQYGVQSPYGKTYYTGQIGTPERTQITELTPEGQKQFEQQQQIATTLGNYGLNLADAVNRQNPNLDFSNLPTAPWNKDYMGDVGSLEKATYDRSYNLLSPQFEREQSSLDTRLANQGITRGSEAYNNAQDLAARQRSQQLNDLALASVGAGRQEQSRLFGLDQSSRQNAMQEQLTERTQLMNELAALLQGSPALATPQTPSGGAYNVQPADYQSAANTAYQGALQNAQSKAQANQAMFSNLIGLGTLGVSGAGLFKPPGGFSLSDMRLKRDIKYVETLPSGVKVYDFKYLFGDVVMRGVFSKLRRLSPKQLSRSMVLKP